MSVCPKAAKAFILYRERHKSIRDAKERAEYIEHYITENDNAATGSEVDDNANIQNKNVATLEAEIHKARNIEISRYRITKNFKNFMVKMLQTILKILKVTLYINMMKVQHQLSNHTV